MIFPRTELTWQEVTDNAALERAEQAVLHRDKGLTQTEAARKMKTTLSNFNNWISRNGIPWPTRQGRTTTCN